MSKITVPDNVLERLKCSMCSEFLSHLPVMNYPDVGVVCGRCPTMDNASQGRPEVAYEIISELLLFPCRYQDLGCLDQFTPKDIKEHEESCPYRTYFCPSLPLGTCHWQGPSLELQNHYEAKHNVLVLKEATFELDLVNRYEENYMLPHQEQLFIVQVKCDQGMGKLCLSVRYVGTKAAKERYSYQVEFTALGGSGQQHMLDARPVESDAEMILNRTQATEMDIADFDDMFDDPTSISCKINILLTPKTTKGATSGDGNSSSKEDIEWDRSSLPPDVLQVTADFLRSLECPICSECMVPPILQCINGHSLCGHCKEQVGACPICHAEFNNVRNFALENLTAFIPYSCKYQDYGCNVLTTASMVRTHEAECKHGPYECPLKNFEDECKWKGKLETVMAHVREEHGDCVYDMGYPMNITLADNAAEDEFFYIFQCENDVFRLGFRKDEDLNYWFAVQLVGPVQDAKNFLFELDFGDPTDSNRIRFFVKLPCNPYTKDDDGLEDGIVLTHRSLKAFMVDRDIQYRCKVTQKV